MEATERDVKTLLKNVLDKLERGDESAPIAEEDYFITPKDICDDLQYFAEEIFDGEVTREQNAVLVRFRNGQAYRISVSSAHDKTANMKTAP